MEKHKNALPHPTNWPDRPIFIQPINDTSLIGKTDLEPVRLGELTPFESSMFKGACLFRLKSVKSIHHQADQDAYFSHPNTCKMVIQIAVQGQFKEPLHMSDVYTGEEFENPLPIAPPKLIGKIIEKVFCSIVPGITMDIYSDRPKVLCRIGGGCHSMSIDAPGKEPDLDAADLPEKTMYSSGIRDASERKRLLSRDDKNPKNLFHTDLIYTFNNSDEFLDLGNYDICLPFGKLNLVSFLGADPLGMNVLTGDGRNIYSFKIWHEKLLKRPEDESET